MSQVKIIAVDTFHGYIVSSDEPDVEFTFKNGKWKVKYTREKTFDNGGIEIDGPSPLESDEVEVSIYDEHKILMHA